MYQLNFCAGPASLPESIYQALSQMVLNYHNTGLSLLSFSHRDQLFAEINNKIKQHLRTLLALPESYEILLMPAGASAQFAAVPINLKQNGRALYINSGYWAAAAIKEAKKFIEVDTIEGVDNVIDHIVDDYDYIYYTENETIDGVIWQKIPETNLPLVCDMSSSFLSKPIDVTKFDLIYAGAQKNIGLPGVTVVLIKKALIENIKQKAIPAVLSYQAMQQADSLYNTPDMFAWAAMELVLADLIKQGGLDVVAEKNARKAALLYEAIDQSKLFSNKVSLHNRSPMNIVFQLPSDELTAKFLNFADSQGVYGIAGHRSVGGVRVSLYNAIEFKAVEQLVSVMREFETLNA
ncbi:MULTISPECIES: 3-phosphoserine/phosphohydroxythreonine transaminase [Cysteiniphilum]|uniref:Phosphoserine aminotransferase n=1 Tax=Cysteiniphilum litorale TaxID=2056700 RepID=A0A8J3E8G5_9GAMM|nr:MULTISPECIES: 3-phosphoserine/phosphohydroxythreonine transaminase [Cysteiniphilum]GGF98586.1 phosphoserine aminotransferase [Cysteiniphilum litorale]